MSRATPTTRGEGVRVAGDALVVKMRDGLDAGLTWVCVPDQDCEGAVQQNGVLLLLPMSRDAGFVG